MALEAMVSQGRSSKRDTRKGNTTVPCFMCSMAYTSSLSSMLLLLLPALLLVLSFLATRVTAIPDPVSTLKMERINRHLDKINRPAVKSIQVINYIIYTFHIIFFRLKTINFFVLFAIFKIFRVQMAIPLIVF